MWGMAADPFPEDVAVCRSGAYKHTDLPTTVRSAQGFTASSTL